MTLAHGADLRSTNRYRGTALIPAAERGHVDTVRTLIDAGVDVDHVNRLGWTALLEAIMLGDGSERYVRIVQLLVAGHANVNLADSNGETPLRHARQRGYGAIERVLVAAGRGRGGAGASVRRSGPYVPIEMKRLRPRGEVFQMERSGVPERSAASSAAFTTTGSGTSSRMTANGASYPAGICPEANASTSNRSVNSLLWLTFAPMTAL